MNTTKKGSLYYWKVRGIEQVPTAMIKVEKQTDEVCRDDPTEIGSSSRMHEALRHINNMKVKGLVQRAKECLPQTTTGHAWIAREGNGTAPHIEVSQPRGHLA